MMRNTETYELFFTEFRDMKVKTCYFCGPVDNYCTCVPTLMGHLDNMIFRQTC